MLVTSGTEVNVDGDRFGAQGLQNVVHSCEHQFTNLHVRDHDQRPEILLGLDVVPKPVQHGSKDDEGGAEYRDESRTVVSPVETIFQG